MTDRPIRVQLSRRKGWRMPPNTIRVSRPSEFGNPYQGDGDGGDRPMLARLYREYLHRPEQADLRERARKLLRGKNLACWCPVGPCHADALLEVANQPEGKT